jgi:16S rRNA (guanine527-N7)-methyltransferase
MCPRSVTRGEFADKLTDRAFVNGIHVPADRIDPLWAYYQLLATWNRKINLTSINLQDLNAEGIDRLFIEPVAAAQYARAQVTVIDIGSGGGSPAIPFAIATTADSLAMIESRSRKSVFLQEAARVVGVKAQVVTARYEEAVRRADLRAAFDVLTVRAVRVAQAELEQLTEFLRVGGVIYRFQRASAGSEPLSPPLTLLQTHELTGDAHLHLIIRQVDVSRGTLEVGS